MAKQILTPDSPVITGPMGLKVMPLDISREEFPNGAEVFVMRSGELQPALVGQIPAGSMALWLEPHTADLIRAQFKVQTGAPS
jgi:hypothetical protein